MRGVLLVGAVIGCATVAAQAGTLQVLSNGAMPFNVGNGGEFTVRGPYWTGLPADISPSSFQTFCIEVNEHVSFGQTYDAALNTEAVDNAGLGNDPLDAKTAFLYYNFRMRTLASYEYDVAADRRDSARALQLAMWYIEDEIGSFGEFGDATAITDLAQIFYDAACLAVEGDAMHDPTWFGLGNVRVLNLTLNGNNRQDMLVIIPLPQTAGLAGLGLGLVAVRRRRSL